MNMVKGDKEPRTGEAGAKNEVKESEPARELLILNSVPREVKTSVFSIFL